MTKPRPKELYVGLCPACGKRRYASKSDARNAAKDLGETMSAYQCGTYWHMGHLPRTVKAGLTDRRDLHHPGRPAAAWPAVSPFAWPGEAKPPLITLRLRITCPSCLLHMLVEPGQTASTVLAVHMPRCTPGHALHHAA